MTQFLPRVRIALDILVQIRDSEAPFPLHKAKACSLSYAEQLIAKLKKEGLVKSMRGPGGGYVLALPADRISVTDIMQAVEYDFFTRNPTGFACNVASQVTLADVKGDG